MTKYVIAGMMTACLLAAGCEKTTVEGPNSTKLTLVKPADSTVQRGSTDKVAIVVKRTNFSEPITVSFSDLPDGVSVTDDGGKIEGNERTFVLRADENADLVSDHAAKVSATGPAGITATEVFHITVKEGKPDRQASR